MLVRVGSSNDVAAGTMRAFDVGGTKVNVASVKVASMRSMTRARTRGARSRTATWTGRR